MYDFSVFVPFSGILLIYKIFAEAVATSHTFSSPSPGCYLSIMMLSAIGLKERESFRPLIRGVTYLLCFYNGAVQALDFSSPSRGCYLSIGIHN